MPVHSDLDPLEEVIRTTLTNPLTIGDIRRHLQALHDSHALTYPELVDARDVQGLELSGGELRLLAWAARTTFGLASPASRAVVVKGEAAVTSARFVSMLMAGSVRLGVFEDEDAAMRWLEERKQQALPPSAKRPAV
jgi:hypothetical protein